MAQDWRAKLANVRNTIVRGNVSPAEPVFVNLGIDFGTRFTKVCYRDRAQERSGIVNFGKTGAKWQDALLPSVVMRGPTDDILVQNAKSDKPKLGNQGYASFPYLKMLLADRAIEMTGGGHLPGQLGNTQLQPGDIEIYCARFLSDVISRARDWVVAHEVKRLAGREIRWSANVGVPVEYCDSPAIKQFQEVFGVAWKWAERSPKSDNAFKNLRKAYAAQLDENRSAALDCHAVPEIAAAVQSFTISRQSRPGVYLYFDVGAGTVDGVAFRFSRDQGTPRLDFYAGKVERLGLAETAARAGTRLGPAIEGHLYEEKLPIQLRAIVDNALLLEEEGRLHGQVGKVVMSAKKKDRGDWLIGPQFHGALQLRGIGHGGHHAKALHVFVGGGGMQSDWYRHAILSTYEANQLGKASIPPFVLNHIPEPPQEEFGFNGVPKTEFHRFAIAYGLSVPLGEGPEVALPSQFADVPFQTQVPDERPDREELYPK